MGTLSEFMVGDTPVIGSSRDSPRYRIMAAQIEPTMSPGKRSIVRSAVYPMRKSPGPHKGARRREDSLASVLTEAPRTMRPKRRAGASITA
jgi:hypothetical protein